MAPKAQPAWKIYEDQMESLRYGHALWEPTPTSKYNRVSIGDVGFIRQGRFHLLFSAGLPLGERRLGADVPNTFEQLRVATMEPGGQRDPCCVAARTSRQPGTNIAITVPSTQPLQPGVSFSYELTGDRGAALTTRHPTYTEDSRSESEFKRYTKRHYKSWVKFARDKKYGTNLRPVLVSGFDMAKDFAIMAYSNVETSVHSGATFSTPMFGSTPASSSWMWRTSCSPHVKHGPQELLPPELRSSRPRPAGNPSTEFNQCVFVRYYTMREETNDAGSILDTVIRNVPYEEGRDSWDIIADYVFRNSNAKRVLLHHNDLAGLRAMGHESDISSLLAIHKPRVVVGEDGVGSITRREDALSSQPTTVNSIPGASRAKSVCNTPPNADYHWATPVTLDADIKSFTTSKDTIVAAPLKDVFESVINILCLVKEKMAEESSFVELARLCSRACHALQAVDGLAGFGEHIEGLRRIVSEIESAVTTRANRSGDFQEPLPASTEESVNTWQKELRGILSFFDENSKRGSLLGSESGSTPALALRSSRSSIALYHPVDVNHTPEPPLLISDSDKQALQRLASSSVSQDELPALIESVVTNVEPTVAAKCLERNEDAQRFIDVIDQALESIDFAPLVRSKCVRTLYKMCARHSLLPKSLQFELPGGKTGDVRHYGGYADVLKRGCGEREVAIKALRARDPKLEALTNRFYKEVIAWKSLRHPNILPLLGVIMTENQFAMVSEWMTNGNIKEFTAANQHANRYQLLAEVANGLKHMHNQEMVHGNLTGANILIDESGRARLAGFGLLTIASDGANTNSYLEGGTSRWMSPELFDPEKFGLKDCRPTKSSDRYAFGMVMYEVLSGEIPFSGQHGFAFVVKVLNGERPTRPEGVKGMWFTDGIWSILEGLWKPNPGDRSLIKEALDLLEEASRVWTPPPPQITAGPPSTAPSTRNSESSTEESIDESEESSSQMMLPQPSQRSRSEELLYGVRDHDLLGTAAKNLGGSGELERISDRAPSSSTRSAGNSARNFLRDFLGNKRM